MALSDLTSPTAIKLAIQECDRLGREQFLRHYKFWFAREYVLRYKGKEYDSKAIGCVAHALQHPELGILRHVSGGKDAVGKRVFELGFDVDGLKRRVVDWTLEQCEITADSYFKCLEKKLQQEPYNRAAACREVAARIGRTEGAVDYKFQNIDAVLLKHGLPRMMNGVAENIQRLLEFVVLDPLARRSAAFGAVAEHIPTVPGGQNVFVPVPQMFPSNRKAVDDTKGPRIQIDFAGRDARNRKLGYSGEEWVVALEQQRLKDRGFSALAEAVRWTAKDDGDGLGYDILSFDEQGQEKYIEVKTTNAGATTPFFITPNELAFADQSGAASCLYRVFDFGGEPKIFVLEGPLTTKLQLETRVYSAVPKFAASAGEA
jgi:hypothetical protein